MESLTFIEGSARWLTARALDGDGEPIDLTGGTCLAECFSGEEVLFEVADGAFDKSGAADGKVRFLGTLSKEGMWEVFVTVTLPDGSVLIASMHLTVTAKNKPA